jgi:3-deoxy-D-arabino-heptulosonate 7-phosphate (DAHP) synthase class II
MRKIPLALMGVLAPRSAHARTSARPPIDTSRNFSAHMSGGGINRLKVFLINFLAKSDNSKHFSVFSKKIPKIVATFISASSQGQRTHSARTNSVYQDDPKLLICFTLSITHPNVLLPKIFFISQR